MSLEKLKAEVNSFSEMHHADFNEWHQGTQKVNGRDVLEANILKHHEERGGLWREKNTGRKVDIQSVISQYIQQKSGDRPLIRNRDLFGKYVPVFQPRSADKLARHSAEMTKIVKKQLEKSGYVFISADVEKKVVELFSQNFIAADRDGSVHYHRISSEGITAPQSFTFDELTTNIGIHRFINADRTKLQQQLFESNLRAEAAKLSGKKEGSGKNGEDDPEFTRTLERLKRVDGVSVGKTLTVDADYIKSEFTKQARIETNFHNPTLDEIRRMDNMVKQRYEALNSIEDLAPHFNEIQVSEPQSWDI